MGKKITLSAAKPTGAELTTPAGEIIIIWQVTRPLSDDEYDMLSGRLRSEQEHTGFKIMLVPYSVEAQVEAAEESQARSLEEAEAKAAAEAEAKEAAEAEAKAAAEAEAKEAAEAEAKEAAEAEVKAAAEAEAKAEAKAANKDKNGDS